MDNISSIHPYSVRSIWISDTHLGFRGCQAELLLNFLHSVQSENLFLVGDIIDCWSLKRNFYWPQLHNNVLRTILGKAKYGTKVIYVPGNHDELFREHCGSVFGNVEIHREFIHTTANGRRLLILHGDEFDNVVTHSRFFARIGSHAYGLLLHLNVYVHYFRRLFNFPYWSLAAHLKHKVKNAVNYISNFETAITTVAENKKVNGVVCGHIHHAQISEINGVLYCNDGDWVESCTALIETHDGELHLIRWTEKQDNSGNIQINLDEKITKKAA